EYLLGAVSVVDVPIQDEDPPRAVRAERPPGRERGVVEDAEPPAGGGAGVIPRGPEERKRRFPVVAGHGVHREQRAAHRPPGHGVGCRPDRRVGIEIPAPGGRRLPDRPNVLPRVDPGQDLIVGRLRFRVVERVPQRRPPEERFDRVHPLRALRVARGGNVPAVLWMRDETTAPAGHGRRRMGRIESRRRATAGPIPSGARNTAVPATNTDAPASTAAGAVSGPIPPSTAISNRRSRSSLTWASARIFASISGMNGCPPLPGSTVITSTPATAPRTHSAALSGVAGLRATHGCRPSDRIRCTVW